MTRTLTIAAIFALLVTASAEAAAPQPYGPARALSLAQTYWQGATPSCGQPSVLYITSAQRRQMDALAGPVQWTGFAYRDTCQIAVRSRDEWKPDWALYCSLVVHEYGHLLGYEHNQDPTSIMYAGAVTPRNFPRACGTLRVWKQVCRWKPNPRRRGWDMRVCRWIRVAAKLARPPGRRDSAASGNGGR